jgi:hypothetical protein
LLFIGFYLDEMGREGMGEKRNVYELLAENPKEG